MKNIFDPAVSAEIISRINKLTPDSRPQWGKMSVDKMLAHCNVTYEMVYQPEKFPKTGAFKKFMLKALVKNAVVSEQPYRKNSQTAPEFLIKDEKNFKAEKEKLVSFIQKTTELGANYFNNKESHSFGPLTSQEWNNLFYKHLDHHLNQFGV